MEKYIKNESPEQMVARLVELEKKLDEFIRKTREQRLREHNILKEVNTLLRNATVLLPNEEYSAVIFDDAGYVKQLIKISKIIKGVNTTDVSGGYHRLVDDKLVIDEERKRLLEEMDI